MTAPVGKAAPPLDVETPRACADRLLAHDNAASAPDRLETLTRQLHGHLMPAVP
ncbi:hypothetical protein [Streptomyces massasporeus]|uniref:hypothetical protein n=1 Tax=Streptomyces massasporeus TaxID=67324 RepID=UPI00167A062A|nr:hypothetical protein [Streptomyces massasporeus]GGV75549.1 hypothetical protein GCM10010228_39340 [Streptomyces massasporeus]